MITHMIKKKNTVFVCVTIVTLLVIIFSEAQLALSSNPTDLLGIWKITGTATKYKSSSTWEEYPPEDYQNYYYEFKDDTVCIGGLITDDKIVQPCPEIDALPYQVSGSVITTEEREGPATKQEWQIKNGKLELLSSDNQGSYKIIMVKVSAQAPTSQVKPTIAKNLSEIKCDGNYYQFWIGSAEILAMVNLWEDPDFIKKLEEEELLHDKVELANNTKGYTNVPFKYSYYVKRDIDGEGVIGKSKTETREVGQGASYWLVILTSVGQNRLIESGIQPENYLWDGSRESGGKTANFSFSCQLTPVEEFKRGENPCVKQEEGLKCDNLSQALKNLDKVFDLTLEYSHQGNIPQLKKFPKKIERMKHLQFLSINQQDFKKIPESVFKNLSNLQRLHISQTPLTKLPVSIGKLQNLYYLQVRQGSLKKIPAQIGNMKKLSDLDLSYNQIRKVPKEMARLQNIFNINLSYNQITNLPDEWSKLKLSDAYALGEKGGFEDMPPEAKLIQLDLTGNPINEEKQTPLRKRFPNLNIKFSEEDPFYGSG